MGSVAKRDENFVPTIIATSNADGATPVVLLADPSTHVFQVDDASTGSDVGGSRANRDVNRVTTWMAVSSADGVTPVVVYADPATGKLLTDSS